MLVFDRPRSVKTAAVVVELQQQQQQQRRQQQQQQHHLRSPTTLYSDLLSLSPSPNPTEHDELQWSVAGPTLQRVPGTCSLPKLIPAAAKNAPHTCPCSNQPNPTIKTPLPQSSVCVYLLRVCFAAEREGSKEDSKGKGSSCCTACKYTDILQRGFLRKASLKVTTAAATKGQQPFQFDFTVRNHTCRKINVLVPITAPCTSKHSLSLSLSVFAQCQHTHGDQVHHSSRKRGRGPDRGQP